MEMEKQEKERDETERKAGNGYGEIRKGERRERCNGKKS